MVNQFAAAIIRWRWLIIIASISIVFLIARGAATIGFSSNYRVFFSEDNENLWLLKHSRIPIQNLTI